MKNNKGMTLVEIIISIALIAIVLLFLFMLLVTVNDINTESEVNSSYLINKSLILKNIEEDLSDSKVQSVKINKCDITEFYEGYGGTGYFSKEELKEDEANMCIQLRYTLTDPENAGSTINSDAYLGIYYYKNKDSYVISYIHGTIKATRLLEKYEKYNVDENTGEIKANEFKIKYTNANIDKYYNELSTVSSLYKTTTGLHKITIPIIGPDEKDYSILISYYGTITIDTTI